MEQLYRSWEDHEEEYLRKNYGKQFNSDIAKTLGRTKEAVKNKALNMGLSSNLKYRPRKETMTSSKLREIIYNDLPKPLSKNIIEIKTLEDHIYVIPIGDIHAGAGAWGKDLVDYDKLQGYIDWIKDRPNAYMLGMGDYGQVEMFDSPGVTFEQLLTPDEQYILMEKMFKPIKDRILGLHIGNHDFRTNEHGLDKVRGMCSTLNVPFLGFSCCTYLKINGISYSIYSTHGHSSSKTPATKLQACMSLTNIMPGKDIYLMGHMHDIITYASANEMGKVSTLYAITGHFMRYKFSYAEDCNMRPGKTGCIRIRLDAHRWDPHISI